MDYSEYYHENVIDHKPLPESSWTLRVRSYITNHVSIWNNWLYYQTNDNRNSF